MKVLLVGGGSGGHITPLLAVAKQLKNDNPAVRIHLVSERFGRFDAMLNGVVDIDKRHRIFAGKLRRYHDELWWQRLLDFKTIFLNIRDVIFLIIGLVESLILLLQIRPNVIFFKGGYVGVPVGLSARLLRKPYITHDSDAAPGLTNRLIGKGARYNAVGMKEGKYPYNSKKIIHTGVPIANDFLAPEQKQNTVGGRGKQLLILGGSSGAVRLDQIMLRALKPLLTADKSLQVVHQVASGHEDLYADYPADASRRIRIKRLLDLPTLTDLYRSADVVISRAGATAIAELAALKKPLILVPASQLSGGHQLENARILEQQVAAVAIDENRALEEPMLMINAIKSLLNSESKREDLAKNLARVVPNDATERLSRLLLEVGKGE